MLKTVTVESFKSLESVEVDLGLVNVFIGANGSGKSNLLEAIGVLGAAANGRVDDEALLRRGVRPGRPALYMSGFRESKQPEEIRLTATNEGASFSVGLIKALAISEPAWRFQTERLQEGRRRLVKRPTGTKRQLDPWEGFSALKAVELPPESWARELLADLRNFAIYSPNTGTLRGLVMDPQSRTPVGLNGGRLAEAAEELFRSSVRPPSDMKEMYDAVLHLIDWSSEVMIFDRGLVPVSESVPAPARILSFRDRFLAEGRDIVSAYDAGEGALYVLFMTVLVHHPDAPPVLAVDNFDHALNPRLARVLTRKVCEWVTTHRNRQLLLTSHNPLVLDGLPLRDDQVRLFTVGRSHQGKTVVRRVVVDEELLRYADEGVPLSEQWVMGTFGGVPNI